jgi:hypothetical protein
MGTGAMGGRWLVGPCLVATMALGGCSNVPVEPATPAWADVAPIFRGECNSCHGWTARATGSSYRFDFFEITKDVCGDAAMALDPGIILAGNAVTASQVKTDIIPQAGARWPRMPPQPSPALPDWERDVLDRWSAQPVKGTPPEHNEPPILRLSGFPASADKSLAFTAVLEDPDDDAALGVIEVNGVAFLMNRTGSFDVRLDSSTWPAGAAHVNAVVCDGWARAEYDLGAVRISHP